MTQTLRARLRLVFGGRRGTARLALLIAAVGVLAGLTVGHGVSAHAARSGYDLAWLPDDAHGQVVQVDPVRGKPNVRLQVAGPNADLDIQQTDGQLVIVDHRTGKITSVDLGTLLTGGTRAAAAGANVKVLVAGPLMYLADLDNGTIQAVDPRTEANVGTAWSAGTDLVDVGIDGARKVWALDSAQQLVTLEWRGASLVPVEQHALTGTGNGSVIIGHDRGVTVVGAQGTIARVGTGDDSTIHSSNIGGSGLAAPDRSPRDIVPVADPSHSSVVIVGRDGAVSSPTAGMGCADPGGPLVFDGKVYVPCLGAGTVLVLDSKGNQARKPIHTPGGGDPQLTVSGGHLIITAPGSSVATVIDTVGDSRTIQTADPRTPVQDPGHDQPADPPDPPAANDDASHHGGKNDGSKNDGGGRAGGAGPGDTRGTGGPGHATTAGGDTGGSGAGALATATARADGTVLVSWQGPDAAGGYRIGDSAGTPLATVSAGASSATVTTLEPGTTTVMVVHALTSAGHEMWTAQTGAVTVGGQGISVSGLKVAPTSGTDTVVLSVSWNAAPTTRPVTYDITATGASPVTGVSATTAELRVPCSATCTGSVSVTPKTSLGAGRPTTTSFTGTVSGGGGGGGSTSAPTQAPPTQAPTQAPPTQAPPTQAPPTSSSPPPAAAMPAGGQNMITTRATPGSDSAGPAEVTVMVTAPSDWAAWTDGSCSLIDTDYDTGIAVPCNANGWTSTLDYEQSGTHTYQVRATAHDGRIADSAGASATVRYTYTGCGAQVPFVSGPGVGARRICDGNPMCGQVYCFAAPHDTAQLAAVADVRKTYLRARPAATTSASASDAGLIALLGVLGGAMLCAGFVTSRRRNAPR